MSFEFKFKNNFFGLTPVDFDNAYEEMTVRYYGVSTLWSKLPEELRNKKRELCYNYLVAWYLADMKPFSVRGIDADGRPVSSKSIGGVSVSFSTLGNKDSSLQELTTNTFGLKAKEMIETAPEMMSIYR
jgi:hypothetical protein